jgi:chloramphenicol 3-O-phosphotransferase
MATDGRSGGRGGAGVLVWLNGAFGAGKTSVARRIAAVRPSAMIVDPEQIGFLLRRLLPAAQADDFQDLPLWRELTVRILAEATARTEGPVVVPMTLVNPRYFQEVMDGLRAAGVDMRHFTLTAPVATLRRRLRRRLDWPRSRRWALTRADPCAAALADECFAEHIDTVDRSVSEIAEEILNRVGA